jgi:hypothetical protein
MVGDIARSIGDGFMRIFSPPRDLPVPRSGLGASGYPRPASRHGARKPFADNYAAAVVPVIEEDREAAARAAREAGYLGSAISRVIGHNFVGDVETEPDWEGSGSGWTGEIHGRDKDGWVRRCHFRKLPEPARARCADAVPIDADGAAVAKNAAAHASVACRPSPLQLPHQVLLISTRTRALEQAKPRSELQQAEAAARPALRRMNAACGGANRSL